MQPADDDESVPGVPLSAHAAPCPCDDCRVNPPDLLQMDPNSFASFLDTLDDSSSVHDDHGEGPDLLQMDPNSFASFLDTLNDSSPAHDDDGEASGVEESDSDNSWIFCKYRCSISNCPARYPALTRPCAGGVKAYLCIPCWAYLWMEQGFTVEQLKGALLPVTPELIRGFRKLLAKPLSEELVKRRLRFKSPKEGACSVPNCPITFPGACKRTQRLGNVIRDVCESCALVYWMQYLRDGEKHAPGSQDPRRKDPEIIRAWEEFVKQPLPEKYVELRHRSIQKPLLVLKSLDQSLAGEPVPCVGVDTCGVTDISKLVKVRARKLPGTTSHCLVCPPCSKRFQWFFYPATATTLARAAFNFANLPKPPGSTYTRLLVDNPAHHAFWIVVRTKLQGMWIRCPILQRFYTPTYGADHMFRTHVEHAHSGGEEWEFGDVVGTGFMRDVAVSARGNLALIAADILAKTRSLGEAQKQYLAMVLPRGDGVIGEEVKHLNPNPDNDPYDIEGKDLFEDGGVPATVHELLTAPIEPWQTEAPLVQFRRLRKLPRDASKWPHLEHTLLPKFLHRFLHPDDSKIPIHHDHIDGYALDLPRKTPAVNPSYGGVEKEVRYVVKDEVDPIRFRELVKAESTWRVDSIFRYLHGMEPLLRKALDLYMADSGCQKVVAQTVANPEDFGLYGDLYRLVFGSADIAGALAEFFEDREVHCMTLQDYDDVVLTRPRDRGLRLKPRGGRFYGSRHRPEDVPADKRKRDEDEADEEDEDADEYNSDEEDEDEEQFENLWTPPEEDVVITQVYWIYKFCSDFVVFDREREDRLYSTFPYIIAEFTANLLPTTIPPTLYAIIFYLLSNMRRDRLAADMFTVVANCILMQWTTQSIALFASSIFRGFPQASMFANAISLFLTMSAGFSLTHVPVWLRWLRWLSPTFYSFRVVATTQFKDRTFSCEGVTGVQLTQCDGNNVLRGLDFTLGTPLIVWFAAEIGMIVVLYTLAGLIMHFYKPGGVKHAPGRGVDSRGKESMLTGDMDIVRARIDVEVRNVSFKWSRSGLPFGLASPVEKQILSGITSVFPAGQVSAIMGPSGAGKSTLLQLLAHRKLNAGPGAHFSMTGEILFNGKAASDDVQNSVAFVEQEDEYHLSALTVRETLRYAAILRLPPKMSRKRKISRAEEVLIMLGLKDCANVYVGGPLMKGISGGEKRRLSLAVQMINDPSVLVVDEPTSGLDSFIANNVMQCLKDIARSGRTVIVTVHQPRSDIFHSFDNLLILAKGGHAVFSGRRERAVAFMESQGYPLPSIWFNPADHLLDLVSVDQRPGKMGDSRQRVEGLVEFWDAHREKQDMANEREKSELVSQPLVPESRFTPMYIAFPVVWERMFRNLWRQKEAFWGRLIQGPFTGVLLLAFYERLTFGPTAGQDRIGLNLQSTSAIPFVGLISGIAVFPQDRQLFMHEYRTSAAYSTTTFILAYSLMEIPFQFLASLLYTVFMNIAVGMQTSPRIYFEYAVTIWALHSLGESIAVIFASFFDAMGIAVSLVSTALSMIVQMSGILSLAVPFVLQVIAWGTPLKAAQRMQFINECQGLQFHCSASDITNGICTAQNGEQLLQLYGFIDRNTAKLAGIAVATAICWRVLGWLALTARMARG